MRFSAPIAGSVFLVLALVVLDGPERLRVRRGTATDAAGRLRRLALDAWAAGVLAAYLFLVGALSRPNQGLEAIAREMVLAFLPSLLGLAIASIAAMRAIGEGSRAAAPDADAGPAPEAPRIARAAAFAVLVAAGFVATTPAGGEARLAPAALLLHPPALLAVGGAALLLLRVARRAAARDALAPALALSGLLAGLAGLVLSLAGYAARDLGRVTAGLSFLLSSGFAALLGLLLVARAVGGPREGRSAVAGTVAWALLPLAALLFLVCAVAAALTPMTAPG